MIIIIGITGSGKTTLAKEIKDFWKDTVPDDLYVISAGQWAREKFDIYEKSPEAASKLWFLTQEYLKTDPEAIRNWLRNQMETCRPVIVEGLRNPRDAAMIAEQRPDYVLVFLEDRNNTLMENNTHLLREAKMIIDVEEELLRLSPPKYTITVPARKWDNELIRFLIGCLIITA